MKRIFLFISVVLFSASAHAGLKKAIGDLKELDSRWRGLTDCQRSFALGYGAYKDDRLKEAKKYFSACSGRYPVLQGYIDIFLRKIEEGGERFNYVNVAEENAKEVKALEAGPKTPENIFRLAKAYFKARDYKKASDTFLAASEHKQFRLASLEYLATSLARLQRNDEAIEIHRRILREYPKNRDAAAKAVFKTGFLYLDDGRYDVAEEIFMGLRRDFPSYQREQVEWYLAWCAYKLGNLEEAKAAFASIERTGKKDWRARARFWRANVMEMLGEEREARELCVDIAGGSPLGYYGILCSKKLGMEPDIAGGMGEDEEVPEEENAGEGGCDSLAVARELDRIGLAELVESELEGLVSAKRKKDVDWQEVYKLAKRNDAWHVVNLLARGRFHGLSMVPGNRWVWEGAYPKAYEPLVMDVAARNRVDPLFVYSIMREESTFRRGAVSRSGAIGLMQLMPFTAERMMPKKGRFDVRDLTEPRYNIEAGVNYLGFLSKMFKRNLYRTAASYNAGEEAVLRWDARSSGLSDEEFVEEIPYRETLDYVRKVMRSYWIYTGLYK